MESVILLDKEKQKQPQPSAQPGKRRAHLRAVGSCWPVFQQLVWPVRLLVHWPAAHAVHLTEPAAALNVLAGQAVQSLMDEAPTLLRWVPAGHSVVAI